MVWERPCAPEPSVVGILTVPQFVRVQVHAGDVQDDVAFGARGTAGATSRVPAVARQDTPAYRLAGMAVVAFQQFLAAFASCHGMGRTRMVKRGSVCLRGTPYHPSNLRPVPHTLQSM